MISDETAREAAKGVQEVAKTTGTLAELAGRAGAFVGKIIGGPMEQVGDIFTDRIRLFKYKNLCAVADKVEAIHRKRKIEGKIIEIPPRLAIPMLESAALEDNETLREVWARLVANSTDPNFEQELHPGFIEVVRQLSPDEATILNSFLKRKRYPHIFRGSEVYEMSAEAYAIRNSDIFKTRMNHSFGLIFVLFQSHCNKLHLKSSDNTNVYIDNLARLRILELDYAFSTSTERRDVETRSGDTVGTVDVTEQEREEYLKVTQFGQTLIASCIADII